MKPILMLSAALLPLQSSQSQAEVLGFFETASGRQGLVSGSPAGTQRIAMSSSGEFLSGALSIPDASWKLAGDKPERFSDRDDAFPGGRIAVAVSGGTFVLPSFGATYFSAAQNPAVVHFQRKGRERKSIQLPISGGEIRAFKVHRDSLTLLVYDRKSHRKQRKDGVVLFAVEPTGKNVLIRLSKEEAIVERDLKSDDPDVRWWDTLFKPLTVKMNVEIAGGESRRVVPLAVSTKTKCVQCKTDSQSPTGCACFDHQDDFGTCWYYHHMCRCCIAITPQK